MKVSNITKEKNIPSGGSGTRSSSSGGGITNRNDQIFMFFVRWTFIIIAIFFALFPVVWVAASAFNPEGNVATRNLIPEGVDSLEELLVNFDDLMFNEDNLAIDPFWNWMANSLIVASIATSLSVLISALAAYAFSRFRFYGRRSLLLGILLLQAFPNLLAMVALFLILREIGRLPEAIPAALPFLDFIDWSWIELIGLNSHGGLILVYLGGAMGVNTWLMKGFFDSIPRDIDESALVDGASHWQIFWSLIFPLVRPILAVVGVLSFVGTMNEFVLARVILRDKEQWTLMVGLFNFINQDFTTEWGKFAAGSLVSATPIVILYLLLQDQIVGGLTAGSVKG